MALWLFLTVFFVVIMGVIIERLVEGSDTKEHKLQEIKRMQVFDLKAMKALPYAGREKMFFIKPESSEQE